MKVKDLILELSKLDKEKEIYKTDITMIDLITGKTSVLISEFESVSIEKIEKLNELPEDWEIDEEGLLLEQLDKEGYLLF